MNSKDLLIFRLLDVATFKPEDLTKDGRRRLPNSFFCSLRFKGILEWSLLKLSLLENEKKVF